ncbi:MAG TPA: thiamine pyrophosphate-binding protein, partial [Intrasporangium sp.]|nr:thiamine pyrophosphate-binding protein [Intrasporangium sp.]
MPLSSLPANGAFAVSLALVQALWARGVRDVVLAPGSRSAPLALVLHRADAARDLRLHVRVDERSAGFLALGLATGSRRPVVVVTTSGTAVGNLLPAVMEAHHTGRPVVVVSADRPQRLRGTGANQTTIQAGIFGRFAPGVDLAPDASLESVAVAAGEACCRLGPTQINVQLDGDLMPANPDPATWWSRPEPSPDHGNSASADRARPEPRNPRANSAPADLA